MRYFGIPAALLVTGLLCHCGGFSASSINGTPSSLDGPQQEAAIDAPADSQRPGGFVSSTTDSSEIEPGANCNADGSNCTKAPTPESQPSSGNAVTTSAILAFVSQPPPAARPPAPVDPPTVTSGDGAQETCTQKHFVQLHWNDGLALDWTKEEGADFPEKMKAALVNQFDNVVKDRVADKKDICTQQNLTSMSTAGSTVTLIFMDTSPAMSKPQPEFAFHTKEELEEFLSHTQIPPLLKLPGK